MVIDDSTRTKEIEQEIDDTDLHTYPDKNGKLDGTHDSRDEYPKTALNDDAKIASWNAGASMTLRTLLLDLPIAILLFTYASMCWFQHIHDSYLEPQMKSMDWTDARMPEEITYYERLCTVEDMTTRDGADLFLPRDATPQDAYDHQLEHGFTVFRSVVSPEAARDLRAFVTEKNRKLSALESIFVIENENRYSFGLGTEEPAVSRAIKELATHSLLRPSLEKIIGPNPALIEMTAITAANGAAAQWWHDDVITQASAIRYAHTFGPSYSVFIPLQNTTKEMGATAGCPGTHLCSAGDMEEYCPINGFQIVGEDGFWGVGDALLMNMNSHHRGGAHTDPNGGDRVMLILTFAPRIEPRAESRQLSQGITFSLRWDMWGHTLYDLADPDKRMTQPWATLRALGLYKPRDADWGVDFCTGTSSRLVNDYNMYVLEDLETYIEKGGMDIIPPFLRAHIDFDGREEEVWHHYLLQTFRNCKEFVALLSVFGVCVYAGATFWLSSANEKFSFSKRLVSLRRLFLMAAIIYIIEITAERYADESTWAADIRDNRRFSSVFGNDSAFGIQNKGPTTLPNRQDVLVDNRHEHDKLALYNDFAKGNPGHKYFLQLVETAAPGFHRYPDFLKDATINYVVNAVEHNSGRILGQGLNGNWFLMSDGDAYHYVHNQLVGRSIPVVGAVQRKIRSQKGRFRFEFLRNTAMAKTAYKYLGSLDEKVIRALPTQPQATRAGIGNFTSAVPMWWSVATSTTTTSHHPFGLGRRFTLPSPRTNAMRATRQCLDFVITNEPAQPPTPISWIKEGDFVEGAVDGHWYPGHVVLVNAHRDYHIHFPDGDVKAADELEIRHVEPLAIDDEADVALFDFEWTPCVVVHVHDSKTYDVQLVDSGDVVKNVHIQFIRRPYVRQGHLVRYRGAQWG